MTNNAYIRQLDPIQGLIDYVEDIKPYHTKIIEVMIEYVYDDKTNGLVRDSVAFSWGPSKFPISVPPSLPQFSIQVAQGDNGFGSYYTGADPSSVIGLGPLGSINQGTLSGLTVVRFYTYGTSSIPATSITVSLSSSGSAASSTAFSSLTFIDTLGTVRILDRLSANDPLGFDSGTSREWTWPISPAAQVFNAGEQYTITVDGAGSGVSNTITFSGDFTDAIQYIMGSPAEMLTIVDGVGNRTSHEIITSPSFGSGVTTVTVSPDPPVGATHAIIDGDVVTYFSFDITNIDDENQTITVSGPATADVFNGQQFTVTGTPSNDGVYTVQGSPTFNGLSTILPVAETLISEDVGISPVPTITPVRYYIP